MFLIYCNVIETDDDDRYVNDDDDGIFLMLLFFLHFYALILLLFYSLPFCLAFPFSTLTFMTRVPQGLFGVYHRGYSRWPLWSEKRF